MNMFENKTLLLWIAVVVIILFSTPLKCKGLSFKDGDKEGFYTTYGNFKRYCPSAGWRSRYSCAKCTNAGWCVNSAGYGECVPGDSSGPYFRDDCQYYSYGDNYAHYPYSHVFPIVQTRSIYPNVRYRLRRPYRWRRGKHQAHQAHQAHKGRK